VLYRNGAFDLSFMARGNPRTGKGGGQIDFAFPLGRKAAAAGYPLKGYLRLFSGYGASLIDYNARQTTLSVGFTLNE
jgi:phospholipase A1